MKKLFYIISLFGISNLIISQTDEDVIRYSNLGIGGTTRFLAMTGAMNALGGDISTAHYNPAGLGIMVKSDLNFSFGLNFANTITQFNGNNNNKLSPALNFNFLGLSGTAPAKKDLNNKYTIAITLNQLQNFNQSIEIKGRPTRGKSITLDMLDYAKGKPYKNLDSYWEGAGYDSYVIDMLDTNNFNSYFSYIDTSKSFLQQQKITKSGRINELAISYAYSFDDLVYFGISMGIPFLKFNYNSDFAEIDDKNQMYINKINDTTFSSSYSYPVNYYKGLGGIKDFHYQSTYTTTATGLNIKLGTIIRPTDYLRIGLYYHSPTWYNAKDIYYYTFITNWDEGGSVSIYVPDGGGVYNYSIVTPSKAGLAVSGILSNIMSVNAEYELIDYTKGRLSSKDAGAFNAANQAIREKYKMSGNLKFGIELNTKPVMFRAGWASYGSPFGNQISGNYVRNSFSIGFGFKTSNFYYDFAFVKTFSGKQEYYMYNPRYCDLTNIKLNLTQIVFTIGLIGTRYDDNIDYSKYESSPSQNPSNNNVPPPPQNNKPQIPY
ncbi:MAG TPA: hypothetical protein PK995_04955 [Bacteroidia bacterium]|nr:hypothetical protein [Bacteroidia bacterium]